VKVLHVIPAVGPRYGGPSAALQGMTAALARAGTDVTVATTNADVSSRLNVPLGVEVRTQDVSYRYFPFTRLSEWKFSWRLTRWLFDNVAAFDIMHVHGMFSYASIPACRAARRAGVPYVVRPLGTLSAWSLARRSWKKQPYYALVERSHLAASAAIHVTSAVESAALHALGFGDRTHVIPLGVDTSHPIQRHATDGRAGAPLRVLFLSRLHEGKNIPLLLEALAMCEASAPGGAELVIAGGGDQGYRGRLEAQTRALGLSAHVRFVGHVDGNEKAALLRNADVFVLPSSHENFGIAIAEAMAAGLPVIVTPGVAIAAEIREAGAGWVVPLEAHALSLALGEAGDAAARDARSVAARRLALDRYSWDRTAHELLALYESVLPAPPERRERSAQPAEALS
jgi:glycosyltransferase involved in cell wall biosynthesis